MIACLAALSAAQKHIALADTYLYVTHGDPALLLTLGALFLSCQHYYFWVDTTRD